MFRNAQNIPQLTSATRVAYYGYLAYNDIKGMNNLCTIGVIYKEKGKAKRVENDGYDGSVVLVIGESHSVFHSPLYGYPLNTNPNMMRHMADSSLIVFNDVVTIDDHTSAVMNSIYSVGRYNNNFYNLPLLPMIIRGVGYFTALYDNQYFVNNGQGILTNKSLSEHMFDFRNAKSYSYDGDMVKDIVLPDNRKSFVIIHLYGQHYTYSERYPESFSKFKPSQYTGSDKQKQTKSEYDNACLYNDYVLEQILNKFCKKDACVVYLSDHGEELFEQSDLYGHGFAAYAPSIKYQIRIPMFVWGAEKFRINNPTLWDRIQSAADLPMSSDDVSHFILDLTGTGGPELDKTRSALNKEYDAKYPRIVLHSIEYDKTR